MLNSIHKRSGGKFGEFLHYPLKNGGDIVSPALKYDTLARLIGGCLPLGGKCWATGFQLSAVILGEVRNKGQLALAYKIPQETRTKVPSHWGKI